MPRTVAWSPSISLSSLTLVSRSLVMAASGTAVIPSGSGVAEADAATPARTAKARRDGRPTIFMKRDDLDDGIDEPGMPVARRTIRRPPCGRRRAGQRSLPKRKACQAGHDLVTQQGSRGDAARTGRWGRGSQRSSAGARMGLLHRSNAWTPYRGWVRKA